MFTAWIYQKTDKIEYWTSFLGNFICRHRYSYTVSFRPFMYKPVEVELRIFFFAPVQILLHVTLTHCNSTIPTIMITYMYKLQSTTVFIIISPQISSYMQIRLLIVSDAGLRWLIDGITLYQVVILELSYNTLQLL